MTTDKCKVGGCSKIGCEGGFYCFNADGTRKVVSEEKNQELRGALKDFRREAETVPSAKAMADRFLGWRLPDDFRPDNGISFKSTFNDHLPSGPYKREPTGTNLLTVDQALAMFEYCLAAAPAPSCLSHDARECLMDVVSHHHDFRTACLEVKAANETTPSDELYWQKQIDVLDRMKAQAERALSADDTKAAPDPAPSFPGVVVVQGAHSQALLAHMNAITNDWTMRAARGECGWICADCCQSFPDGMPDKCCCGHQSCTDIITRDKRDARTGENQ